MFKNQKIIIALIPARGGSKGVKGKNIRLLYGRPLILYTIQAAKDSQYIDKIFVSSDDESILDVAKKAGVEVISRPSEFSTDKASANLVVNHFINELSPSLKLLDPYIVYLQPTSPLRNSSHIDEALKKIESMKRHTIISVNELKTSPFKSFKLDKDGNLESLFDEKLSNARRQDLPIAYVPNGAIYIFRISDFISRGGFPSNGSIPFIMNSEDSIDIDSEADLLRVEQILGDKNGGILDCK